MPVQAPQWTEFLSCPICYNVFNETLHRPISLGCGHTVCKSCLAKLHQKKCPFDQNVIQRELDELPVNFALLQLVGVAVPESAEVPKTSVSESLAENYQYYNSAKRCIEELAIYLKPVPPSSSSSSSQGAAAAAAAAAASEASTSGANPVLSRPMQRKLVSLVNCQLVEEEGRARVMRAARSLGERTVTELILQHQNPQQLSANLWAAVRARGCQFLGPAMQEEVLKLILLALEDGSALSRKVLVLFVVQRLENQYPQASKTAIGHVVQLLYRASCFKVTKRDEESSLMQLKEEFRSYEALRREHDSQIVQIATEAGLRISPEQWSSLLYGDTAHKSHMQSIIDKLQTPQSFAQSVNELLIALQRSGDAGNLSRLRPHFDLLSNIDPSPDTPPPSWENLDAVLMSVQTCVEGLVEFVNTRTNRKTEPMPTHNLKFKTSMCRDLEQRGSCPRGTNCTFAHTAEEMERFRARSKKFGRTQQPVSMLPGTRKAPTSSALTAREREELALVTRSTDAKLQALMVTDSMQARPSSHTSVSSSFRASSNSVVSSVTVPVVKPYSLPLQAKSNISQQTIYTSPTQTREEQQPVIIPISHKAPSLMGRQAPEGGQGEVAAAHSGSLSSPRPGTAILSGSSGHKPEMTTTTHLSQVYKNTMMMGAMTTRATAPAPWQKTPSQVAEVIHRPNLQSAMAHMLPPVDDSFMKHTISLPPNPYTTDKNLPTNDSHYYMATNVAFATRGKSTTEQLGELHRRRRELLVQLNKTQEDSMKTSTNSELSMSVADSFAACRSTMSLANYSQQEEAAYYEDWSGGGDVSADMEGYTQFMDEANLYEEPPPQFGEDLMRGCQDNSSSSHSRPASINRPSPAPSPWSLDGDIGRLDDFGDEFIPFPEHSQVSKYGPISRMSKVKMKNTIPVQVTAAQPKETTPVTAVTPMSRPYPMSFHVSSKYDLKHKGAVMSNFPTLGATVATSLPTALLQPNIIATASPAKKEGQNLWTLREKILNLPGLDKPAAKSTAEREQIRHELARLNTHIENLEISEDERMARELQAIELNIQETERQLSIDEEFTEKEKQVIEDRKLAGQIALSEARRLARPPASNKKFGVDRK